MVSKSYTPIYHCWIEMIRRCMKPQAQAYKFYGARGIQVCDRWLLFANFLEDMGEKPKGRTASGKRSLFTLERLNNDGDYTPENCIWATMSQQNANKRSSSIGAPRSHKGKKGLWKCMPNCKCGKHRA